jgi:hypothetical protein
VLIMNDLQSRINPLDVEVRANWDYGAGIGNAGNASRPTKSCLGRSFPGTFPLPGLASPIRLFDDT